MIPMNMDARDKHISTRDEEVILDLLATHQGIHPRR